MTLNDAKLEADIVAIQESMSVALDPETAKQEYATKLVEAIKAYIISGTVTITGTTTAGAMTGTGLIT